MAVNALIIEAENVLYKQREGEQRLRAFLHSIGIDPRHPQVVAKAVKAARFDALHGRIPRETYYDAILRFHGVQHEKDIFAGRSAILRDVQDIYALDEFPAVLQQFHAHGINLSILTNSELSTEEMVETLATIGYLPAMWRHVMTSSDAGYLIPDPAIFAEVIETPESTAVLSPRPLHWLTDHGIANIVFQPENPTIVQYDVYSAADVLHLLLS